MTSAVLIVPAAAKAAANAFGESMGWGADNYTVALSSDGQTVTHWGCRVDVTQGFLDLMADPPPEAAPLLAVLIADFRETSDAAGHFADVVDANGLEKLEMVP